MMGKRYSTKAEKSPGSPSLLLQSCPGVARVYNFVYIHNGVCLGLSCPWCPGRDAATSSWSESIESSPPTPLFPLYPLVGSFGCCQFLESSATFKTSMKDQQNRGHLKQNKRQQQRKNRDSRRIALHLEQLPSWLYCEAECFDAYSKFRRVWQFPKNTNCSEVSVRSPSDFRIPHSLHPHDEP